ncbi:MAG: PASTA domain-containing protein [Coriobacteriia bacterium]
MIDRIRPQRPPYLPRWLAPAVIVALAALVVAGVLLATTSARSGVEVPDVVGLNEAVARVRLAQAGFTMQVGERPFNAAPPGTVLDQAPAAGATATRGAAIVLVVSEGTEEFEMPDVVGLSARIARAQLEGRGLTVKIEAVESDQPSDTVLATNPAPGATVRSTDLVRLSVATAPDASNALVPFALTGALFVIDPVSASGQASDVTMEVTRRLRALFEASGATVRVTRSTTSTGTQPPAATPTTGTVAAFIGIDVHAEGTGGMAVSTLSASDAGALYRPSYVLADEVEKQLRSTGSTVARETTDEKSLATAGGPALRVRLGSFSSAADAAAFKDPAWADKVARALYRAIGERVGSR